MGQCDTRGLASRGEAAASAAGGAIRTRAVAGRVVSLSYRTVWGHDRHDDEVSMRGSKVRIIKKMSLLLQAASAVLMLAGTADTVRAQCQANEFAELLGAYGTCVRDPGCNPIADIVHAGGSAGCVNLVDLGVLLSE